MTLLVRDHAKVLKPVDTLSYSLRNNPLKMMQLFRESVEKYIE